MCDLVTPHACVITFLLTYAEKSMTFELYVKLMFVIAVYWSSKGHESIRFQYYDYISIQSCCHLGFQSGYMIGLFVPPST